MLHFHENKWVEDNRMRVNLLSMERVEVIKLDISSSELSTGYLNFTPVSCNYEGRCRGEQTTESAYVSICVMLNRQCNVTLQFSENALNDQTDLSTD